MKLHGIKKAIGEYNRWLKIDIHNHNAKIMLDKSTGEIWTDTFFTHTEWKQYNDSNIVDVTKIIFDLEEPKRITMKLVKKYAEKIILDSAFNEVIDAYYAN